MQYVRCFQFYSPQISSHFYYYLWHDLLYAITAYHHCHIIIYLMDLDLFLDFHICCIDLPISPCFSTTQFYYSSIMSQQLAGLFSPYYFFITPKIFDHQRLSFSSYKMQNQFTIYYHSTTYSICLFIGFISNLY